MSTRQQEPTPVAIRRQLDQILKGRLFSTAPRLARFLQYVVERRLAESADGLKEYTIGLEVFDRGESFDPRIDTIVRVHARRLRRRLEEYYQSEGRADRIRIEIPKGGYAPQFRLISEPQASRVAGALDGGYGLPRPRTSLIGRETDLEDLTRLLTCEDLRVATITGVGGSGKTRLAIEAGRTISPSFPGGVLFCPLATAPDEPAAMATLARAFGLYRTGGLSLADSLAEHLRTTVNSRMLAVLDNLEHLAEAGEIVSNLVDACPQLRVLATSRTPLRIYGEHEFGISPLPPPELKELDSIEALRQNPAVQLLMERGRAVSRTLELDEKNGPAIGKICRRLDGLPLAIELAAAHTKTLPPAVLLARLEKPLDLLVGGPRDVPVRQQAMRAALDWSYTLLSGPEQKLFRRLSVFPAGCSLEGAEAAADAYCDLGVPTPEGLSALVDKNLLSSGEPVGDEPRFVMLQTVREYGLERLAETEEMESTRRALAAYCLVLAEETPFSRPDAADSDWMALCEAEHANLTAALDWLVERDEAEWASRLALGLFRYWERRSFLLEGRKYLDAVLSLPTLKKEAQALAISAKAALICLQGEIAVGLRMYEDALTLFQELGDQRGIAREANGLGVAHRRQGNLERAQHFFTVSLETCRELGDDLQVGSLLSNLADVASLRGDASLAAELLCEALGIFKRLEHAPGVAWSLSHLGDQARRQEDFDLARSRYREALEAFQVLGDGSGAGRTLLDLAELECVEADYDAARRSYGDALEQFLEIKNDRGMCMLFDRLAGVQTSLGRPFSALVLAGAASSLRESAGAEERPWSPAEYDLREDTLERAHARLDDRQASDAWETGRGMSVSAAADWVRELDWTVSR